MKKLIIFFIFILFLYFILNYREYYIKYYDENNYFRSYLKNKKVIIVGPADYVNEGEFIDNYDVIVRVNRGHNMIDSPIKYGSRTDILYHCINEHNEAGGKIPNDNNIKFIKFVFPEKTIYGGGDLIKNVDIKYNYRVVDQEKYLDFEKKIKTRPNAGTTAIWDILNYDIDELYIKGFTLFTTNYSKDYRETAWGEKNNTGKAALDAMKKSGNHNQVNIAKYYLEIINHPKVKYDQEFKESIINTLNKS